MTRFLREWEFDLEIGREMLEEAMVVKKRGEKGFGEQNSPQ